jgi:hypothetical protein
MSGRSLQKMPGSTSQQGHLAREDLGVIDGLDMIR